MFLSKVYENVNEINSHLLMVYNCIFIINRMIGTLYNKIKSFTYRDKDHSFEEIHLKQPSHHQHAPLQCCVKYELSVIFVNLQTEEEE